MTALFLALLPFAHGAEIDVVPPVPLVVPDGQVLDTAVLDVNRDGLKDVAVCTDGAVRIGWFLATPAEGWTWVDGPALPFADCTRIAAGDFDNDGQPDLGASTDTGLWAIYLDDAGASPVFHRFMFALANAGHLETGDVDRDGRDGVFAMVANVVMFFEPTDDRFTWDGRSIASSPASGTHLIVDDLDGDGSDDAAWWDAAAGTGATVWIDPDDFIFDSSDVVTTFTAPFTGGDLLLRDLDRDGLLDPVVVSDTGGLYAERSTDGPLDLATAQTGVLLDDLDHDGRLELVGLDGSGWSVAELTGGLGLDRTRALAPFPVPVGATVTPADLDGDADLDLLLASTGGLSVAWNRTPHARVAPTADAYSPNRYAQGSAGAVLAADFTGDGWTDLLFPNFFRVPAFTEAPFVLYANDGTGDPTGFAGDWLELDPGDALGTPLRGARALDYDRDGDLDLAYLAEEGGLRLAENAAGDGTVWTELLVDAASTAFDLADLDRDGFVDLVSGSGDLRWYPNPGDWTAPAAVVLAPDDGSPWDVVHAGDVDRDGFVDLVTGRGQRIAWWTHPGDPLQTWSSHTVWTLLPGNRALMLQLADMDGDAAPELYVDRTPATGEPSVYAPGADPTQPWSVVDRGDAGSTGEAVSSLFDLDDDGFPDAITGAGGFATIHRFDGELGQFESGTPVNAVALTPAGMVGAADLFRTGRPQVVYGDPLDGLRVFSLGSEPVSEVGVWTSAQSGERATWTDSRVPLELDLTNGGLRSGDAELAPLRFDVGATLDGVPLTGAALLDLVQFTLRFDADDDGALDPAVDPAGGLSPEILPSEDVRLHSDPAALLAGTRRTGPVRWLLEVTPTYAASAAPLATLELTLRADSLEAGTVPGGALVDQSWLSLADGVGTVILGNTWPEAPELRVSVDEGGEVVFDALLGTTDPDGDALSLAAVVADPPQGTAEIVTGSTVRFTHDGSEGAEVPFLVELDDGIETVTRLVVVDVVPVDDPPAAQGFATSTTEDVPLDLLLDGSDPDSPVLVEVVAGPSSGTLSGTAGPAPLALVYTPDPNFVGADAFDFVVHGDAQTTAPQSVTIDVRGTDLDDDDGDGVIDAIDRCPDLPDPLQADLDGDGLGDLCDDDDDGDGIADAVDPCPELPAPADVGADDPCTDDDDGDGVLDGDDNCREQANPAQDDLDGDGLGDLCDPDDDGDFVDDAVDSCPEVPNQAQGDADGDGLGDACDEDDDDDGVLDDVDVCPWTADPSQSDADGDGTGDACDGDRDGDGSPTDLDCDDDEPAVWSVLTFFEDVDGDGFGDAQAPVTACAAEPPEGASWDGSDNCPSDANPDQADHDGDGLGDPCDPTPGFPRKGGEAAPEGCGCATGPAGPPLGWVWLGVLLGWRRRSR